MCKEMQFNCYHFLFCGSFLGPVNVHFWTTLCLLGVNHRNWAFGHCWSKGCDKFHELVHVGEMSLLYWWLYGKFALKFVHESILKMFIIWQSYWWDYYDTFLFYQWTATLSILLQISRNISLIVRLGLGAHTPNIYLLISVPSPVQFMFQQMLTVCYLYLHI